VSFDAVVVPAGRVVALGGEAAAPVARLQSVAAFAMACDALGAAARATQESAEYAKVRRQFGRPIGSFQAIKHMCADMAVAVETGRAAVGLALDELVTGDAPTAAVSTAKAYVGDTAVRVCTDAVQAHGGIGFTWEHDAHLWLKRALLDRALFGSSSWHRRRVADAVLPALSPAQSGSSPTASRNGPG
jgi:alkylation response protein AidB-like acyl-CoA dehydrogenase